MERSSVSARLAPPTGTHPFGPLPLRSTHPAGLITGRYVEVESTVRMVVFPRSTIFSRVVRL